MHEFMNPALKILANLCRLRVGSICSHCRCRTRPIPLPLARNDSILGRAERESQNPVEYVAFSFHFFFKESAEIH